MGTYNLYKVVGGNDVLQQNGIVAPPVNITGQPPGTAATWKLSYTNDSFVESLKASITVLTIPAAPTGHGLVGGSGLVTMNPGSSTGALTYHARYTTDGTPPSKSVGTLLAGVLNGAQITGLSDSTTVKIVYWAENASGQGLATAAVSAVTTAPQSYIVEAYFNVDDDRQGFINSSGANAVTVAGGEMYIPLYGMVYYPTGLTVQQNHFFEFVASVGATLRVATGESTSSFSAGAPGHVSSGVDMALYDSTGDDDWRGRMSVDIGAVLGTQIVTGPVWPDNTRVRVEKIWVSSKWTTKVYIDGSTTASITNVGTSSDAAIPKYILMAPENGAGCYISEFKAGLLP